MANISDATGTITITSDGIETVWQIVNIIHKHLGNVQYSTTILTDTEEVMRNGLKHSKNQPLALVIPMCDRYTEYDINRENLCMLGFDPEWILVEEEDSFV